MSDEHTANLRVAARILQRLIKERDDFIEDWEGWDPFLSTGCIDCTLGTVPTQFNTGCCPYHQAKRWLRINARNLGNAPVSS